MHPHRCYYTDSRIVHLSFLLRDEYEQCLPCIAHHEKRFPDNDRISIVLRGMHPRRSPRLERNDPVKGIASSTLLVRRTTLTVLKQVSITHPGVKSLPYIQSQVTVKTVNNLDQSQTFTTPLGYSTSPLCCHKCHQDPRG